jgi:hypothetical protein
MHIKPSYKSSIESKNVDVVLSLSCLQCSFFETLLVLPKLLELPMRLSAFLHFFTNDGFRSFFIMLLRGEQDDTGVWTLSNSEQQ